MSNNVFPQDLYNDEVRFDQAEGLTKRELFAAMALQAHLSNPHIYEDLPEIVKRSVAAADLLSKALT